jgi:predicted phage-related endonuclease
MSSVEIISKIEALKEMEALIREAEAEAEKLKEEIKAEMTKRQTEEMSVGRYIVRWTSVVNNRFDSKVFQTANPELYNMYVKQTQSRRFSIVG